ncbi:MAG TPA: helix-turn-helix transcriptional regulator [Polyangiaceae bacterium]|nr:helix-turn-helix transcriptional regulator [Polyangiaceae bacterium]
MKPNVISIVEAAYDVGGDVKAWLERLLDEIAPRLDRGFGVGASMYAPDLGPQEIVFTTRHMPPAVLERLVTMSVANPEIFHRVHAGQSSRSTVTEALGMTTEEAERWSPYAEYLHSSGVRELGGVLARDPSGHVVVFTLPMPDTRRPGRQERALWSRIAAHVSAGARLHRAVARLSSDDLTEGAEAVLSPSGALLHGDRCTQGAGARESLRRAAKAIDLARSKARPNDAEALELWQALIAGQWSLVEHFDTDGRRFLVAHKNDPQVTGFRTLTVRERQVLAYVAMGHPLKLIAYTLGLSISTVSQDRRTAMRKMGLETPAAVVAFFAEGQSSESPHGS